jgi:Protein of unknown function (DUF4230)
MKKSILYILLIITAVACSTEEELPTTSIYEIREIGELSTTEYTIGKIVRLEDTLTRWDSWTELPEFGERQLLMSCKAKVKAGVDLSKVKDGDIIVEGKTIQITVPPAQITSFSMDPSEIHTVMESVSGLKSAFTQSEKNKFLKQGEEAIKNQLGETKILQEASENTEAFLVNFYKQLGFDKVVVNHKSIDDEQ